MPPKKPAEGSKLFHKEHYKETFYLIIALAFIGAIFQNVVAYWSNADFSTLNAFSAAVREWAIWFWHIWKPLALLHIIAGLSLAIYSSKKIEDIKKEEEKVYGLPSSEEEAKAVSSPKDKYAERWERALSHANSSNPSDWRLAIIEADIMLEDVLRSKGFHGESLGDMLKSAAPGDLATLDNAWEAHKVRNRIAHSGSAYELSEREEKRVVMLFESVFRELEAI